MDHLITSLRRAAHTVTAAADACQLWEDKGESDAVSDTAWEADGAILEAVEAVAGVDSAFKLDTFPETRLGRLMMAARLLVLVGTDEGGKSLDFELAAALLEEALQDVEH